MPRSGHDTSLPMYRSSVIPRFGCRYKRPWCHRKIRHKNRHFGGEYLLLAWFTLWSWRRRHYVPPICQWNSTRSHGVISRTIVLFIAITVRASMLSDVSLHAYDPLHRISIRDCPMSGEYYAIFPRNVWSSGFRLYLVLELHINNCQRIWFCIKTLKTEFLLNNI
jgi:hypothetical protein